MSVTKTGAQQSPRARRSAAVGARCTAEAAITPIRRVMTAPAITVTPQLSIDSLRQLMLERGLSRVPVADPEGRCRGIVSFTDLVVEDHDTGGEAQEEGAATRLPDGFHVHGAEKSVGDVMSRAVLSIADGNSIAQVAELFVANHLHGAPVCSGDGTIVGFVSSSDILAWIAGLR